MNYHSTYYGVNIYRNWAPSYKLPWTAMTPNGSRSADTLAGVRELIRVEVASAR